jgi:hypothetical protein
MPSSPGLSAYYWRAPGRFRSGTSRWGRRLPQPCG